MTNGLALTLVFIVILFVNKNILLHIFVHLLFCGNSFMSMHIMNHTAIWRPVTSTVALHQVPEGDYSNLKHLVQSSWTGLYSLNKSCWVQKLSICCTWFEMLFLLSQWKDSWRILPDVWRHGWSFLSISQFVNSFWGNHIFLS